MKHCTKCGIDKPFSDFGPRQSRAKGATPARPMLQSHCFGCVRSDAKARQAAIRALPGEAEARRAKAKQRTPEYRQSLRAAESAKQGKAYQTKAEQEREAMCRTVMARAQREIAQGQTHKAKAAFVKAKPWRDPTLTKAEQFAMRYRLDAEFALTQRVRAGLKRKRQQIRLDTIVRSAVKRNAESSKATAFLGYSMRALHQHIGALFSDGMDWPAFCRGEIHIDHIRPLASFDLSDADQLRQAWQMENLQPLWAAANLAKGAKWAA